MASVQQAPECLKPHDLEWAQADLGPGKVR